MPRTANVSPTAQRRTPRAAIPPADERLLPTPPHTAIDRSASVDQILQRLFMAGMEIVAGTRPLEHISRWVSASLFLKLRVRAELERQQRTLAHEPVRRPGLRILRTVTRPADSGLRIECLVVFANREHRTRVATIVFERIKGRWLASEFAVL